MADGSAALLRRYRDLAARRRKLAELEGRARWYREEIVRLETEIKMLAAARGLPPGRGSDG